VIGNYENNGVDQKQYQPLETLIQYLTYIYGIDLNNERYYHRDCNWEKCNTFKNKIIKSQTSNVQKILTILQKYSEEEKRSILKLIDIKKQETKDKETLRKLQTVRLAVMLSLR